MSTEIRLMEPEDVVTCGNICFEAFKGISSSHNFPWDFPNAESAIQLTQALFANSQVYSIVAEAEGKIIGSNHLWEYDEIRAVGPITVDPATQAKGVGRMLMQAVIERGKGSKGIRLVQDAFNGASFSLYTSLGFDVREPLIFLQGLIDAPLSDQYQVRKLEQSDLAECGELCRNTIGTDRNNELLTIPPFLPSFVAIRDGKIRAYASAPHFWALNHSVAETNEDMQAVLTGACLLSNMSPISFLFPARQSDLFRWLLNHGMRIVKPMNLMSMGYYEEPKQVYIPSVGY